jgi:hypothetical protein
VAFGDYEDRRRVQIYRRKELSMRKGKPAKLLAVSWGRE